MLRKSDGSVSCASSAMVPASSTPVGPAPIMTKVSRAARVPHRARARRVRTRPGCGVGWWWRPPAFSAPGRMAPIRRGRSRHGVRRWRAPACRRATRRRLRAARAFRPGRRRSPSQTGSCLLAPAQQIADRPGDFRCRQRCGRDLIQQRLEQMMVAAVDQCDLDRRPASRCAVSRPPKPAPTITTRWDPADAVVIGGDLLEFRPSTENAFIRARASAVCTTGSVFNACSSIGQL